MRTKRNRRLGTLLPGTKTEPTLKLAVGIDNSGSVSDQELATFFTELDALATQSKAAILVGLCDTEIHNKYTNSSSDFRSAKLVPNFKKMEFEGRGGTFYQPMVDMANSEEVDGLIIFGDMDSADDPTKPKIPVLWVSSREGTKPPADFGRIIYVDPKTN